MGCGYRQRQRHRDQRHDAATGSTTIDSLEWTYATGLSGPAGLTSGPGGYTLVSDAANGTGLTAIPEPSAALLSGLGLAPTWPLNRHAVITI